MQSVQRSRPDQGVTTCMEVLRVNCFTGAIWRTNSRSNDQGLCVEVANNLSETIGLVGVRDSKDISGPTLAVSPLGWTAFVTAIRSGQFDR